MLQIASGKFFSQEPAQSNQLRGVLYTNLQLGNRDPIETVAGRLLPTSSLGDPGTVVYEFTELIEDTPAPGVPSSHLLDPYIDDFAFIVSFALDVTCTPDAELTHRLTLSHIGHSRTVPHGQLVRGVFDSEVSCRDEDAAHLVKVAADLIGLRRKSYLAAMRAIRTYVNGLRRLADDPELTYTLMIASIESLSNGFEVNQPTWEDYPEHNRRRIDIALKEADNGTAVRVRALLEIEHIGARHRFCEFALDHVAPSFFREEASGLDRPVGRAELREALKRSYNLRSRHIHALEELPTLLRAGFHRGETISIDRITMLTLQGITRLTRHVITQFIARQPQVETEDYDYRPERSGIVLGQLAPQYWVGRVDNLTVSSGRRRLEGFLTQLGACLSGRSDPGMTDLRSVLRWVEKQLPNMNADQRRPFLALYVVYNQLFLSDTPMEALMNVTQRYQQDLGEPSPETMLLHLLLGTDPRWSLEDHYAIHDSYLQNQGKRGCLRVPKTLIAGLSLALAERYRASRNPESAKALISTAIENYPGHEPLRQLEQAFDPAKPVDPLQIIRSYNIR